MFRKIQLTPTVWHAKELEFEWDPVTGEIRGRDADRVLQLCAAAVKDGSVTIHPMPTYYPIKDPLHSWDELRAILSVNWSIGSDLQQYDESDDVMVIEHPDGRQEVIREIN